MTKFYVTYYSTARYEGSSDVVFDTIEEVVAFLNARAETQIFTSR